MARCGIVGRYRASARRLARADYSRRRSRTSSMNSKLTVAHLRRYAVARSLFAPTGLEEAVQALGFVQADPIRAPARAQDLTLRHRVTGYRAGDLERLYPTLAVEEDAFVNYGFLPRAHYALMHPRVPRTRWGPATRRRAQAVLDFVRERGDAHPRDVDAHFAHGAVRNYWGGSSNATTHLLDGMHYRGLLRVARRDNGIRVYAAREQAGGTARRRDAARAARCARRHRRAQVRAAAACEPQPARAAACATARRNGAAGWTARSRVRGSGLRMRASTASTGTGPTARIRARSARRRRRSRAPARTVRSRRLGPRALRAVLELGVPLRGVHAAGDCASSATTRCRSCGATRSSAGRTCR